MLYAEVDLGSDAVLALLNVDAGDGWLRSGRHACCLVLTPALGISATC